MEQRSAEWYQARLGKVTASRVVDVMKGVKGKYLKARETYMLQLAAERLTGEADDNYESSAMKIGIEMEPMARIAYEGYTGELVEEVGFVDHPTIKNFGASPDGLVGTDGGLEVKCPKSTTHLSVLLNDEIDREHKIQMHVGMICCKRKWWEYVNFDHRMPDNLSLYIRRVELDKVLAAEIVTEVTLFLAELDALEAELRERVSA